MKKYIKIFEQFKSHQEIEGICDIYNIKNYTINEDLSIDVNGNVNLNSYKLKELPLIFRNVKGYFTCSKNELTSLKGSPKTVGDYFNCSRNRLTSLEYSPIKVNSFFVCNENLLTNLVGSPKEVNGYFKCDFNNLKTLEGCSNIINGDLYCGNNPLYSFEYVPDFISGDILFPYGLMHIFKTFGNNKELLGLFSEYNITKSPVDKWSLPRLKVSNLNKFLVDNGFEPIENKYLLSIYFELK